MGMKALRSLISSIGKMHEATGARAQATDLYAAAAALEGHDHRPVSEVAEEIKQDLSWNEASQLVELYVNRLSSAGLDRSAFDAVFLDLKGDRRIKKPQAAKIAHLYCGGRDTWKTKSAALDEIEGTFVSRAYQANKMKIVDQYKSWG